MQAAYRNVGNLLEGGENYRMLLIQGSLTNSKRRGLGRRRPLHRGVECVFPRNPR